MRLRIAPVDLVSVAVIALALRSAGDVAGLREGT
jgi:hypothetical protein